MSLAVAFALYGTALGVGLIVGGCVALFNSWMP